MSDEPSPSESVLGRFAAQSRQEFNQLLRLVEAQDQQAKAMRAELGRLAANIQAGAQHRYSVFANAATKRLVVLRDVDALRGAAPLYQSSSFLDALAWVNAHPPAEPLPDEPLQPPLGPGPLGPIWPPPKEP
ncbi:MAG: hypothetical protein JSR82_22995 [Verrucomicrobia bacterium]|nr:hypothetical protein [Verrucomicrobiota bacterium]